MKAVRDHNFGQTREAWRALPIPMIVYGVAAEVSIGELYVAGFGPGLLIAVAPMVRVWVWCRIRGYGRTDREGHMAVWPATKAAGLALMMPVIILGGIYGGVFTPTEASIVAVYYALVVSCFIYHELDLAGVVSTLRKSVVSSSVIMMIIAMAGLFSFLLTRAGIPAQIGTYITATFENGWSFLLAVNLFLFVIGMFIETSSSLRSWRRSPRASASIRCTSAWSCWSTSRSG